MTFPVWLDPLSDAERARAADAWAIEQQGTAGLVLMERAAAGLADYVQRYVGEGLVVVVCGKGNNGGDGYAAARMLRNAGRSVRVLFAGDQEKVSDENRAQQVSLHGEQPLPFSAELLDDAAVVVDALLGTGFSGKPKGEIGEAIAAIQKCGKPVVAADVPSGVDASTGEAGGAAVAAQMTVTFGCDKIGLHINPGREHSGATRLADIGIQESAPLEAPTVGLIKEAELIALLPRRGASSNKFTSGHLYLAAGSRGLTGAAVLAGKAAMRAGAGYVTACVPASEQPVVAAQFVEVMQMALPGSDGHHCADGASLLAAAVRKRPGAVLLGPGIGSSKGARSFARAVAESVDQPMVIDADGLNAYAGRLKELAARRNATVLTPHEGELARLLDCDSGEVKARRLRSVRLAAKRAKATVVLKGVDTLVCSAQGVVAVSPGAPPALATAGTGDVLGGIIGALLARGVAPFEAACAGVRLHARAAALATAHGGAEGMIASDLVASLPLAWD
ncbi:MAG: NAD(P)H-hydrate dehydratase [Actinobacteria bacterium]|uniref:Nicotinamide nucleotide repair protein n=1 Tax=freshwater metagenome TaxID=449393 RepID=A0A6J5ZS07_9ZZZZ|nr:NAD(P)H-hydrate dehydratase [Actinomycetota bacterium]